MRIAIDASRTTVAHVTGTEHYAIELIRALIRLNTQHELTLYFRDPPSANLFPASPLVSARVLPQRRLWTHTRFAAALWHDRPDVTFVPAHALPVLFPGCAAVTVHDVGFHYFPAAHPRFQRLYLDWATRNSARRARVVFADSHATADDLARLYRIAPVDVRVVYPGVDAPSVGDVEQVRHKLNLPQRYFLFIGTLQPRKNIERLVQAYRHWRAVHRDDDTGLVLAGGKGWLYDPAWTAGVEGLTLTGYVDDADKGALYAGALALVFPSLYEGFGFPLVEAMLSGTPVIASNTSSLPEIAGDAALLVDPLDSAAIAAAMGQFSDDEALRNDLIARGRIQATRFTWDVAASEVLVGLEAAALC